MRAQLWAYLCQSLYLVADPMQRSLYWLLHTPLSRCLEVQSALAPQHMVQSCLDK